MFDKGNYTFNKENPMSNKGNHTLFPLLDVKHPL
jgi:hypothetical protein